MLNFNAYEYNKVWISIARVRGVSPDRWRALPATSLAPFPPGKGGWGYGRTRYGKIEQYLESTGQIAEIN